MATQYTTAFLAETVEIINGLDADDLDAMAEVIAATKRHNGRLFIAGSGGGAGHASHAVCDFRKLAGIEAYSVTDNVSELTARINDNSWADSYADWLTASRTVRRRPELQSSASWGVTADMSPRSRMQQWSFQPEIQRT